MVFLHFKAAFLCSLMCFTIAKRIEEENEFIPGVVWDPRDTSIFLTWDHPVDDNVWPDKVQGYVVTYLRTDKIGVDVPTTLPQLPAQALMHNLIDLKPGTSYEVMISVMVNMSAIIGIVRYNTTYHQMKTTGYGPDNGCRRCDIMHTKEDPICDPFTGECNCVDEMRGDTCSTCKFGAVMVMLKCQSCNCNTENSYGNCSIDASDEKTVLCHCRPGFNGSTCDLAVRNETVTDPIEPSSTGSVAAGIIITLLIVALLIGVVYVCRKRLRTMRRAQAANKWQVTAPSNDYSTLADSMEPSATSDPFSDTSAYDSRKQQQVNGNGSARSARNYHLSA